MARKRKKRVANPAKTEWQAGTGSEKRRSAILSHAAHLTEEQKLARAAKMCRGIANLNKSKRMEDPDAKKILIKQAKEDAAFFQKQADSMKKTKTRKKKTTRKKK